MLTRSLDKSIANMKTMLLLSTCYSSNIGGTGVITGSGTNLVAIEFLGNLDPKHHGNYASLTFATWMGFNVVPMLVNIFIAWLYLQLVFLGLPNRYRFSSPEIALELSLQYTNVVQDLFRCPIFRQTLPN
jgi:sodium-dependent dicarboxylate transporter 2/3/5